MAQGHKHTGCGGVRLPRSPSHRPPCLLSPTPREVLGLVDLVALENGELGPLLSPGTLRGLEDECVTDVKVLGDFGAGGTLQGGKGCTGVGGPPLLLSLLPFPFSLCGF